MKADTIPFGFHMNLLRLRPVTAVVLSLWLGFLACVLGCVQPMVGAPPEEPLISELKAVGSEDGDRATGGEPCCHHSRGTSEKGKHVAQTVSCCPLDATVIQKHDLVPPLGADLSIAILMLLAFRPAYQPSASVGANPLGLWQAGRDVLLQAHVLRI